MMKRIAICLALSFCLAAGCASRKQQKISGGLEPHHSRMDSSAKIVKRAVDTDDTSTVWNWFKSPAARKGNFPDRL